jgi:hypothetical protein
VVEIFPGRDAIVRLIGAVLAEQNEILAACRKPFSPIWGRI